MITFEIKKDVNLSSLTSWQIGGRADFFCAPKNITELKQAYQWALEKNLPTTLLGGGSNVLISDRGVRGLVLSLKSLVGISILSELDFLELEVYSGTPKSELLKVFLKYKLPAALFLSGLPGEVGGGVVMNAGVSENIKPKEFCEIVNWIEVLKPDGSLQKYNTNELQWEYRQCKGWQPGIILRVGIKTPLNQDLGILKQVKEFNRVRLSKQPLDMPSCGSVFKNPEGHKAAELIERCGLKGFQIGQAQVSMKHSNFIVNLGKASSEDTWKLIQEVKSVVKDKTKIELHTEVVKLGEWL
jgi:UDP-N-acetylmuramate dehydrogenase